MIFGNRFTIQSTLVAKSDLFVGGTDRRTNDDGHEVSTIVRWHNGQPVIPASSLKGALRRALMALNEGAATTLFGQGSEHANGIGSAATLWIDHSVMSGSVDHVRTVTHVALDPATGASEDNKLFNREEVASGAEFLFRAEYFGEDLEGLAPVVAVMEQGFQIGGASSKGFGQISLNRESIEIAQLAANAKGVLEATQCDLTQLFAELDQCVRVSENHCKLTLKLRCEGPYMSVGDIEGNTMTGRHTDSGEPALLQSSIAGALRSRARWLAESLGDRDAEPCDQPNLARDRDALLNGLSEIEQLFGVSGRKAALKIGSVNCTNSGQPIELSSNSIDRLTGAARDTALFVRRAAWQPEFKVDLQVPRDLMGTPESPKLIDHLLANLRSEGLELGHASSVGFGWFDVGVENHG
ncbi:MAG: hypothetical protein BM559_01555 [Roseobacter sp. MedPE-SWchi]|nr:MAG: hypothetical protein BM559_01555 [Roseobacter sp. MedPE-SWchi]